MKDMKPVAWIVSDGGSQFITTKEDELKNAIWFNWTVTPLCAIPDGCVVVRKHDIMSWYDAFQEQCTKPKQGGNTYARNAIDAMIKAAQEEGDG